MNTQTAAAGLMELLSRYPHWRVGQAFANVASWTGQEPGTISDADWARAAEDHLRRRFPKGTPVAAIDASTAAVLDELMAKTAEHPTLGGCLTSLARSQGRSLYDLENAELLAACGCGLQTAREVA